MTATSKLLWERQPGEPETSFTRFQAYLNLGPSRSLALVARSAGVSRQAVAQTAQRWAWEDRAAAWDAQQATPTVVLPMPPRAANVADQQGLDSECWAALEEFRAEAESLGKGQVRLARGLSAAATKNAARLLKSDKPLSPRDIASLASTSAQLASSGTELWAKAVGLDRQMAGMHYLARETADTEVVDGF